MLAKIGSVQTVILPVLGQILMGLVIDSFGLFYVEQSSLTVLHATGAVFVAAGVLVVSRAKDKQQNKSGSERQCFLLWRIFGVIDGMLSTIQIAVNGYLGKVVDSPMKASAISFATGIIFLGITCIVIDRKRCTVKPSKQQKEKHPWWIWFGGILGSLYILANVTLSSQMSTGMTVIILLMGTTTGGLLVDHFGLFGTDKKPVNVMKVLGVLIMIAGAAVIKLF